MSQYLTVVEYRLLTLLPVNVIDEVEARTAGWLDAQLRIVSSRFDARLTKRYAAPFVATPYPTVITEWLAHIVDWRAYLKRGVNSLDTEAAEYKQQHDTALTELQEAANSETGLFELPLRQDVPGASGVSKGGPQGYSEASPYVWMDEQADVGHQEDQQGSGTFR